MRLVGHKMGVRILDASPCCTSKFTPMESLNMRLVNPVAAAILHLLGTAVRSNALLLTLQTCWGIIFLHLVHREPEIKFYAFYAGIHAIVMSALRLLGSRGVYRKALAKKNETPQSSTETAPEATGTEGAWEDEKLQGVSQTADLLV
ncbi:hypothetical protein DFH29DRAFT_1079699 [Suillus ampliporus]|nr:hypothetical protein DFH29DRAFT_1079699 [Suillus ampliporus]